MRKSIRERIEAKTTIKENGCWEWNGALAKSRKGKPTTPQIAINSINTPVRRYLYSRLNKEFNEENMITVNCGNTLCINPKHYKIIRTTKDCCANGHKRTTENTYIHPRGDKVCKLCRVEENKRYFARKKIKSISEPV